MTVRLRPASDDDAETVRDIAWRSWASAYGAFLPAADRATFFAEHYGGEGHRRAVGSARTLFLIAEDDAGPMAFLLAVGGAGRVNLLRLYADPSRQRAGAGQALWDELVRWARSRGASQIGFEVAAEGVSGPSFYRKQGCRPVGDTLVPIGRTPVRIARYVFDVPGEAAGR